MTDEELRVARERTWSMTRREFQQAINDTVGQAMARERALASQAYLDRLEAGRRQRIANGTANREEVESEVKIRRAIMVGKGMAEDVADEIARATVAARTTR